MVASEHHELFELIERVFQQLGGRATRNEVLLHVISILPRHLQEYLVRQGLGMKIGQYFRSIGGLGLPKAPAVGDVHVQLELLSQDEIRYLIAEQMKNSETARQRALQYANLAHDRFGVRIDVRDPFDEQRRFA